VTKKKAPGERWNLALWLPAKRAGWRQMIPNPKEKLEAHGFSREEDVTAISSPRLKAGAPQQYMGLQHSVRSYSAYVYL